MDFGKAMINNLVTSMEWSVAENPPCLDVDNKNDDERRNSRFFIP
jgi:hypothetical protein